MVSDALYPSYNDSYMKCHGEWNEKYLRHRRREKNEAEECHAGLVLTAYSC